MEPVSIFDVVDGPSYLDCFVLFPFVLASHWIDFLKEKLNLAGGLDHQAGVVDKNNLTHVAIIDLVVLVF